jgi:hypothetical protein
MANKVLMERSLRCVYAAFHLPFRTKQLFKHSYGDMAFTDHMTERRKSPRQKSLFRGVVSFADGNCTVECIVRDISETGARLKFNSAPPIISEYLDLNIPIKARTYRGKVVWATGAEIGVAFETNVGISAPYSSDTEEASHSSGDELTDRVARLEAEIIGLKQMIKRLQRNSAGNSDAA